MLLKKMFPVAAVFVKLATSILDDPLDIATFLAHVTTGSGINLNKPPAISRVVRMNPLISPVKKAGVWTAPTSMSAAQFKYLVNLDVDAVQQPEVNAISGYADLWLSNAAPNQPIRMNEDTLASELGSVTVQDARAAWVSIR
jgi:hypothetical protein